MFDLKYLITAPVLLAALSVLAPACNETDDDSDAEGGAPGTGGLPGSSGEAGESGTSGGSATGGAPSGGKGGSTGAAGDTSVAAGAPGDGSGGTGNEAGSAGSSGAEPGPAEGGSGGDATGEAGAPSVPKGGGSGFPSKWGVVMLNQGAQVFAPPIGALQYAGAQAVFGFQAGEGGGCEEEVIGACTLRTSCVPGVAPSPDWLEAGEVVITGLDEELPLPFQSNVVGYMSAAFQRLLWTSSLTATVSVEGSADVPAYEMDLVLPNPIQVTSPAAESDGNYSISRGSALNVVWNGGAEGFVTVSVSSDAAEDGDEVAIQCIVDASEGELSVPESFMAKLGESGGFGAGVTTVALEEVEDWTMQFQSTSLLSVGTATFTD